MTWRRCMRTDVWWWDWGCCTWRWWYCCCCCFHYMWSIRVIIIDIVISVVFSRSDKVRLVWRLCAPSILCRCCISFEHIVHSLYTTRIDLFLIDRLEWIRLIHGMRRGIQSVARLRLFSRRLLSRMEVVDDVVQHVSDLIQ
ncbi:unnamed protein product [Haemonchus placei]|uniref:Secreted protein n=1 Tax=Haemonchus placei TaxID=6290 RepID=A0A0N4WDI8_HAEPC|nr:unnamed protein product [Haemonchus placei]